MPFGVKPECIQCHKTETAMWRNTELGYICNECSQKHKEEEKQLALTQLKEEASANKQNAECSSTQKIILRKSTRMTRNYKTRQNPYALPKPLMPKGKGRRSLFKKMPQKTPTNCAQTKSVQSVFVEGMYLQVGDIVEVSDVGGGVYFAQLRGLLVDSYGEKSGVLTWLVPTTASKPGTFDPASYIRGPEEDLPRRLSCMRFLMRCPDDYFGSRTSPYPRLTMPSDRFQPGYIWTRLPIPV